jgi:hypothetical protein
MFKKGDMGKLVDTDETHTQRAHLNHIVTIDEDDSDIPWVICCGERFPVAEKRLKKVVNKGKRGRPRIKPKPIKFLLKYDLDEDPIEEFSTMDEVKERIDYLVKNERSLKRDSMVVYEIRSKKTVSVETKIKLSK